MGIVFSMLMIAAGAIMRYAVTVEGNGFDVGMVGAILMIVGGIGAVLSVVYWASWGGFSRRTTALGADTTVVHESEVR